MEKKVLDIKEKFLEYAKCYDSNNPKIKLKIDHILRVAQVSKEIAMYLNLDSQDLFLAQVIGFFHDIGRFEQIKRYNTFLDKKSIDHGLLGCQILFEENYIKNFNIDEKYYEIIEKAIRNHNKFRIQEGLDYKTELMCKIIRDADKIDILRLLNIENLESIYGDLSDYELTKEIINDFYTTKQIRYKNISHPLDILIAHFAYIYDFNFPYSLGKVLDAKYIQKHFDRFNIKNEETKIKLENVCKKTINDAKNIYILSDIQINSMKSVDYEKAEKRFLDYANCFEKNNYISRKVDHSKNVAIYCEIIAKSLDLSKEMINLAKVIGIYHDIGSIKNTDLKEKDENFDHGQNGVILLNENEKFFDLYNLGQEKYINSLDKIQILIKKNHNKEIILNSILNHNKYEIQKNLNEENLLFAKIIRDADKLDIYEEAIDIFFNNIDENCYGEIDKSYLDQLDQKKCIKVDPKQEKRNYENSYLKFLSFVYDINFKESFKIIKEKNYIKRLYEKFKFSSENDKIIKEQNEKAKIYIDEKLKD